MELMLGDETCLAPVFVLVRGAIIVGDITGDMRDGIESLPFRVFKKSWCCE